jgi:diguanylate cyclase (GGDEF)-like protein
MILRSFLIGIEVLFITVLNYYMSSSYYSLDVLYCLPVIQTARIAALQTNSTSGTYTLPIVAITCAIAWSAAEAAVVWPSFPASALLMNVLTRGVTFTIIARVIAKLWKEKESVRKDSLTGVANRQELSSRLEDIQLKSKVSGNPYTLLYINIDDFREFNEVYGHERGDEVLKQLAVSLQEMLKVQDVVSRIASDEFFIILTETNENLIRELAVKFCRAAENKFFQNGWKLTLSCGYTTETGTQKSLEELIRLSGVHLKLNRKSNSPPS